MFLTELTYAEVGKKGELHVAEPSKEDVERVVAGLLGGRLFYATMKNEERDVVLSISSQSGLFGLSIFYNEEAAYRMWNGESDSTEWIDIGAEAFPEHLVIRDQQIIADVLRHFAQTGQRLEDAEWMHQEL